MLDLILSIVIPGDLFPKNISTEALKPFPIQALVRNILDDYIKNCEGVLNIVRLKSD